MHMSGVVLPRMLHKHSAYTGCTGLGQLSKNCCKAGKQSTYNCVDNNLEASPLSLELLHDFQKGIIDMLVVRETVFDFPQITQCV